MPCFVAARREREWLVGFIRNPSKYLEDDPVAQELLVQYRGARMPKLGLSIEKVEALIDYLASAGGTLRRSSEGRAPRAGLDLSARVPLPSEPGNLSATGIILFGVLLLATGLSWKKSGRPMGLALLILTGAEGYLAFGGHRHLRYTGNQQSYQPTQPLAYSHANHAGKLGIGCLYCHYAAERSSVAGVPPLSVCMNCHHVVKGVAGRDEPSEVISDLDAIWATRSSSSPRSVRWIRVHRLPSFSRFSHRAHVNNNILCQECHGPVETMETLRQAGSLSMGWCVDCHRRGGTEAPTHWTRTGATLDCVACHR